MINKYCYSVLAGCVVFIASQTTASANGHCYQPRGHNQPSSVAGSPPSANLQPTHRTHNRVGRYWTPERMRNAKPEKLGVPAHPTRYKWKPWFKRHRKPAPTTNYRGDPVELQAGQKHQVPSHNRARPRLPRCK